MDFHAFPGFLGKSGTNLIHPTHRHCARRAGARLVDELVVDAEVEARRVRGGYLGGAGPRARP